MKTGSAGGRSACARPRDMLRGLLGRKGRVVLSAAVICGALAMVVGRASAQLGPEPPEPSFWASREERIAWRKAYRAWRDERDRLHAAAVAQEYYAWYEWGGYWATALLPLRQLLAPPGMQTPDMDGPGLINGLPGRPAPSSGTVLMRATPSGRMAPEFIESRPHQDFPYPELLTQLSKQKGVGSSAEFELGELETKWAMKRMDGGQIVMFPRNARPNAGVTRSAVLVMGSQNMKNPRITLASTLDEAERWNVDPFRAVGIVVNSDPFIPWGPLGFGPNNSTRDVSAFIRQTGALNVFTFSEGAALVDPAANPGVDHFLGAPSRFFPVVGRGRVTFLRPLEDVTTAEIHQPFWWMTNNHPTVTFSQANVPYSFHTQVVAGEVARYMILHGHPPPEAKYGHPGIRGGLRSLKAMLSQ